MLLRLLDAYAMYGARRAINVGTNASSMSVDDDEVVNDRMAAAVAGAKPAVAMMVAYLFAGAESVRCAAR